jgi:FtsP/CotA-like multicopper oxidase with cupredoxin domain
MVVSRVPDRACAKLSAALSIVVACIVLSSAHANPSLRTPRELCPRSRPGSEVPEPKDLRAQDGVLSLELSLHNYVAADGSTRYCYLLADGSESPTLRLHPGDHLLLRLKNELRDLKPLGSPSTSPRHMHSSANSRSLEGAADPCASAKMEETSTNLHFHGLTIPPLCHQDDVLKTSIQPTDPPFEYRFEIPVDEPPGLYWYHPHIHGFSSKQVLGGASGAMIIEGIERAIPSLAGLPERVLIIRDQDLLNPGAPPSKSEPVVPRTLIDRDGDSANNGTGFGKPAKDLSINFVPVPYPDYPPASIKMKPGERQLWRVVNASSVTYLNLAVVFGRAAQQLGVVAIDGVPMTVSDGRAAAITWVSHLGVPPGARVEFIVSGPALGAAGLLVTRTVDTGQGGENDPNRVIASITATPDAPEPRSRLPKFTAALPFSPAPWIGNVQPTRVRKLYFSEKLSDPSNPNSATDFYITVDGQAPAVFDPGAGVPNIVVHQGDVEDWIIENRSTELHAFHIHQIHFMLVDWSGVPVNEPFLRDTVNVPYYNDRMLGYPSVRLRMDFRDPNSVGTFLYHCHLLEHEDGGMMGTVQVVPKDAVSPPG